MGKAQPYGQKELKSKYAATTGRPAQADGVQF